MNQKLLFVTLMKLGEAEVEDQKLGVQFLRNLKYVDRNNIGIYGHSYGGYMALMCIFKAPDFFKAGIYTEH